VAGKDNLTLFFRPLHKAKAPQKRARFAPFPVCPRTYWISVFISDHRCLLSRNWIYDDISGAEHRNILPRGKVQLHNVLLPLRPLRFSLCDLCG
jgi:hypothetical protein